MQAGVDLDFPYSVSYRFDAGLRVCARYNAGNRLYPAVGAISVYGFFTDGSRLPINIPS